MASSTYSASMVSAAPPATGSTVRLTLDLPALAPVTLEPSLNWTPCLVSERWKVLAVSASMPGVMRSRNSTTVTSAPRRRQTEPSSRPMMPAPMTTRLLGTSGSDRAPVESTMRF